jgi:hypothetical protein
MVDAMEPTGASIIPAQKNRGSARRLWIVAQPELYTAALEVELNSGGRFFGAFLAIR